MSKQDGCTPRTAVDLERRYNFGQTFAEVYNLVTDARKAAAEAQSAIEGLSQEQIFNLLTNFGEAQGIYRDDNGDVYVNASYIKSGELDCELVKLKNLKIDLNGKISFNDLSDADEVRTELGSGITEEQAATIIKNSLVSSPTIRGGVFEDMSQLAQLTVSEDAEGYMGGIFDTLNSTSGLCLTDKASRKEVFSVWYTKDISNSITAVIRLAGQPILGIIENIVLPIGTWDFSRADISGL